jgi:RNA polymerase sigma-70 factor (ECF subfamily)
VEQIEGESADHMYDRQWALTVLDQALASVEQHVRARGKAAEFAVMRPFLTGEGGADDYAAAGEKLGMSANTFKVAVHRLRTRFREALRSAVAETQPDGAPVDEEMGYLMQVLAVA